jgi:PHS family inorganic phosphate transporter-like MFS transporter
MMTLVFMCQPLGQLAATLVTLIATVRQREGIGAGTIDQFGKSNCNEDCLKTLDSIWRWIIGVGVIPAVIALWFRLTIIESPRYTADVGGDSGKAASELTRYLSLQQDSLASSSSVEVLPQSRAFNQRPSGASEDGTTLRNLSRGASHAPPGNNTHLEEGSFVNEDEIKPPPAPSWRDFKDYFWHGGNLRTLMATSLCWFCLDLLVISHCQQIKETDLF